MIIISFNLQFIKYDFIAHFSSPRGKKGARPSPPQRTSSSGENLSEPAFSKSSRAQQAEKRAAFRRARMNSLVMDAIKAQVVLDTELLEVTGRSRSFEGQEDDLKVLCWRVEFGED